MSKGLITGNAAVAWGVRLAAADYMPVFPITPQTEIIERLAVWVDNGEMAAKIVTMDSEHSMITAAGAAAATGVRVFTATSSQGLLFGLEMLYTVAGWRVPMVMANVSRGLAAPITLEPDHNDILAARDCGCLQLHAATCQEVLDATLLAFRISEDARVRLPVIVNLDGFYLSFTREPVILPEPAEISGFLPDFDDLGMAFRGDRPVSEAVAVLGGTPYSYFRYEMHLAQQNALSVFDEAAGAFEEKIGRSYAPVECYRSDDAELVFVMMNSFATKAKAAVDRLRAEGVKIGLVRPFLLRPFPEQALQSALRGKRAVAVIDQNLSMGKGGILHGEICSALYGNANMPPVVASYIGGLGGRDIATEDFDAIAREIDAAAQSGETPPPRLIYSDRELRQMRKLQAVAHVEREELRSAP